MANGNDFKGGSPWGAPPGGDPQGLPPPLKSLPFAMTLYIVTLLTKTS